MRHYFRINKQINLPLSLEAEAYLEEHGLREEVIQWRDNYCVIKNKELDGDSIQVLQLEIIDENVELMDEDKLIWKPIYLGVLNKSKVWRYKEKGSQLFNLIEKEV